MCGIAGIYSKNGKPEELKEAVKIMTQCQSHRGPDDEGIYQSKFVVFGHRRLSIIDLSKAGHQPMGYKDLWITYNGEIYNFLELKKDLEKKGYKFKTKTDTEVILALYAEYGEKSFSMFRGMFAFGLWDGKNEKLFLVKDRYGIKPLYYYSDKEKLIFTSTVKAIIESGLVAAVKNPQALIGFLLFGSVPLPLTTIKNVFAVPAGCYLVKEADGSQKLVKYYDPLDYFQRKSAENQPESAFSKVRRLLEESVNLHLISDAPLGIFLSGGLDSSAIAALAAIRREKPVTTLSVIFEEEEFSEKKYQNLAVERIKSDHREIKITKKDFFDSFDNIFEAMDQPTVDGVNTFFIAQAAKEAGLKAVLSGLGADEIFCGYPSFKRAGLIRKMQSLPRFLKLPLNLISLLGDRYSKSKYFLSDSPLSFYLGIRGLFAPKEIAKILDIDIVEVNDFVDSLTSDNPMPELRPVDLVSYLELKFYLQNQLLKDTDFMSMYHSVEVRVPFLDHKLVECLSALPPYLKLNKAINKPLLVEAVRGLLPEEILNRAKMGFTFPFEKWLRQMPGNRGGLHWSRFWATMVLNRFKSL